MSMFKSLWCFAFHRKHFKKAYKGIGNDIVDSHYVPVYECVKCGSWYLRNGKSAALVNEEFKAYMEEMDEKRTKRI